MKKSIISLIVATCFLLVIPVTATAKFESLGSPGKIIMHDRVYMSDFKELLELTSDPTVRHYDITIHSPGGNAITTIAIMNRILELKREGVTFTTRIYGVGMSAGSYIFLLGDERIAYEGSVLMWHTLTAQMNEWQKEQVKRESQATYNLLENMDNYVRERFKEVSGMSKESVDYWLDGGKAQYMSGLTAYNVGIATKYIKAE